MWVGSGSGGCGKRKTRGESEAWRMPRPSIFEDNPYDVEKPESGVQHTTLGLAGAPTPIRVLDALGPPEMQLHDTKSIDLPVCMTRSRREIPILNYTLSISTYHGERHTRPWAGRLGRITLPGDIRSRARPSGGSARTQAHRHRPLSALHDPSRFQILVASRAILYPPFLSAAADHTVRWKTTGPLPNLSHPSHGDLRH